MSCSKSARGGSHGWLADRGAVLTDRQRVPWWRHHQWIVLSVVLLIVVGGVVSAYLRPVNGSGDATEMGLEELAVFIGVAIPSLVLVPLTRRWRIWIWECLLAVLAWAIFLGPAGDLSCTDCAFAVLIPIQVAALQGILFLVALFVPSLRRPLVD